MTEHVTAASRRESRTITAFLNLGIAARRVVDRPSKPRLGYLAECVADLEAAAGEPSGLQPHDERTCPSCREVIEARSAVAWCETCQHPFHFEFCGAPLITETTGLTCHCGIVR